VQGYHPATTRRTLDIVLSAEINLDGEALCDAALDRNFEEVRFRAHLVLSQARDLKLGRGTLAADVIVALGLPGEAPMYRYGVAIHRVAAELDISRP
jgi:hypothetical protein